MSTSTSVSNSSKTETDYFNTLIDYAVRHHYSVALWRLPLGTKKHLILSRHHAYLTYTSALEDLSTGFIFAPFEAKEDRIFLEADFCFSFEENIISPPSTELEKSSHAWMNDWLESERVKKNIYYTSNANAYTTPKGSFVQLVNDGIAEIEKGRFEKVVLSRTHVVPLPADFDIGCAFYDLCNLYANALVSFVSIPDAGSWMGATPELLASVENKRTFRTTALAGTQAYKEGMNLKSVAWTQKDIEEQALVERYIISCFKKIRLREYDEHGPRTIVAGNLLHLKSDSTLR